MIWLTAISGTIVALVACALLGIKVKSVLADRPRLILSFSLNICKNEQYPREHFKLTFVFKNSGRRPMRLLEAGIDFRPKEVNRGGRTYRAPRLVRLLYSRRQPVIVLEGDGGRFERVFDPFDATILEHLAGEKANGFVVDSLNRRYDQHFNVPSKVIFERVYQAAKSPDPQVESTE